jgi:hypothetical protein
VSILGYNCYRGDHSRDSMRPPKYFLDLLSNSPDGFLSKIPSVGNFHGRAEGCTHRQESEQGGEEEKDPGPQLAVRRPE